MIDFVSEIKENDDFVEKFCEGCDRLVSEYGYTVCSHDPGDFLCDRYAVWREVEAILNQARCDIEGVLVHEPVC